MLSLEASGCRSRFPAVSLVLGMRDVVGHPSVSNLGMKTCKKYRLTTVELEGSMFKNIKHEAIKVQKRPNQGETFSLNKTVIDPNLANLAHFDILRYTFDHISFTRWWFLIFFMFNLENWVNDPIWITYFSKGFKRDFCQFPTEIFDSLPWRRSKRQTAFAKRQVAITMFCSTTRPGGDDKNLPSRERSHIRHIPSQLGHLWVDDFRCSLLQKVGYATVVSWRVNAVIFFFEALIQQSSFKIMYIP